VSGRRRPHHPGITPCTTGVWSEPRASEITPCTTGLQRNHAQHTTTLPRAGAQHNELPYHTLHHGQSAQRAFVSLRHNGLGHAARPTQQAFRKRDSPLLISKGMIPTLLGRPTGWHSAAASAARNHAQKPKISRAKRSAAIPGWARGGLFSASNHIHGISWPNHLACDGSSMWSRSQYRVPPLAYAPIAKEPIQHTPEHYPPDNPTDNRG
jgi:hypothetical protein